MKVAQPFGEALFASMDKRIIMEILNVIQVDVAFQAALFFFGIYFWYINIGINYTSDFHKYLTYFDNSVIP